MKIIIYGNLVNYLDPMLARLLQAAAWAPNAACWKDHIVKPPGIIKVVQKNNWEVSAARQHVAYNHYW